MFLLTTSLCNLKNIPDVIMHRETTLQDRQLQVLDTAIRLPGIP